MSQLLDRVRAAAAGYAPGQGRPLRGYLLTMAGYAGLTGTLAGLARLTGRRAPERISGLDVVLISCATHKVSRLLAKDSITFGEVPAHLPEPSQGSRQPQGELFVRGLQCPPQRRAHHERKAAIQSPTRTERVETSPDWERLSPILDGAIAGGAVAPVLLPDHFRLREASSDIAGFVR